MNETKKFVVVDGPINHDHELYINGDPIELPAKAAARLVKEKKVVPAKAVASEEDKSEESKSDGEAGEKELKEQKMPGDKSPDKKAPGANKGGKK